MDVRVNVNSISHNEVIAFEWKKKIPVIQCASYVDQSPLHLALITSSSVCKIFLESLLPCPSNFKTIWQLKLQFCGTETSRQSANHFVEHAVLEWGARAGVVAENITRVHSDRCKGILIQHYMFLLDAPLESQLWTISIMLSLYSLADATAIVVNVEFCKLLGTWKYLLPVFARVSGILLDCQYTLATRRPSQYKDVVLPV